MNVRGGEGGEERKGMEKEADGKKKREDRERE